MTFRARQMTSFMFSGRAGGDGKTERKFFGIRHIGVRRQEKRKLESFCYLVINTTTSPAWQLARANIQLTHASARPRPDAPCGVVSAGKRPPRLRRNHGQTDKRGGTRTGESGLCAARTAFPDALGGTRKFLGTPSRDHEVPQDAPMSCGSCRSCPGTRQDERSCVPPVKPKNGSLNFV